MTDGTKESLQEENKTGGKFTKRGQRKNTRAPTESADRIEDYAKSESSGIQLGQT